MAPKDSQMVSADGSGILTAASRPSRARRCAWSCERHFEAVELLDLVHLLEVFDPLVEVAGRDAALVACAAEPGQVHDAGRAARLVAVLAADGADQGEGFGGYLADGLGGDCGVTHAAILVWGGVAGLVSG